MAKKWKDLTQKEKDKIKEQIKEQNEERECDNEYNLWWLRGKK